MINIGDKIKISNTDAIIVKIFSDNTARIIYKDKGHRILDEIIFINGKWQFELSGVSGRKLRDSEYTDFSL